MQQRLDYMAVLALVTASLLGACTSVTSSDLYRPDFGRLAVPEVDIGSVYTRTPYSFGSTQPCLMSNPRCTPDKQLQWAEDNQR